MRIRHPRIPHPPSASRIPHADGLTLGRYGLKYGLAHRMPVEVDGSYRQFRTCVINLDRPADVKPVAVRGGEGTPQPVP